MNEQDKTVFENHELWSSPVDANDPSVANERKWFEAGLAHRDKQAEPVAWRLDFGNGFKSAFSEGVPSEKVLNHWGKQGVRIEYAYSAPHPAPAVAQESVSKDAEEWGPRLNEAGWAAIEAWNAEAWGVARGVVFNNIKPVIRAAILKYCEGYTHSAPAVAVNKQMLEALKAAQYRLKEYRYQAMEKTIEKVDAAIAAAEAAKKRELA